MVFSLLCMFSNLVGIAYMLSMMTHSEVAVICLVCILTFNMGIACLSTAMGCNIMLEDCKMCKVSPRIYYFLVLKFMMSFFISFF